MVSNIFYVHPYLGKWSNLTNIFQMGWNHQLDLFGKEDEHFRFCGLTKEKRRATAMFDQKIASSARNGRSMLSMHSCFGGRVWLVTNKLKVFEKSGDLPPFLQVISTPVTCESSKPDTWRRLNMGLFWGELSPIGSYLSTYINIYINMYIYYTHI